MSASLPEGVLKRYKGNFNAFFETGTSEGDSVDTALKVGFDRIYSVEMDPEICARAVDRFSPFLDVYIMPSDSLTALRIILPQIHEPILFFLDAHPDCSSGQSPILQELEIIKNHPYPFTILADDMRLMGKHGWVNQSIDKITELINSFGRDMEILFEENGHAKGDLLVARDKSML